MSLVAELRRRNVFRVGAAYLALAWVVVQITGTVVPAFDLPDWTLKFVIWLGAIGFPFVVVFAWVFELTPEGLKRETEVDRSQSITQQTGRRLDYIIIAMLAAAMLMFAADRLFPRGATPAADGRAEARPTDGSDSRADARPTDGGESRADARPTGEAVGRASARQSTPAAPAPDDKSIAVLPFVNMSSDKEQDYFSDGISEELLNLLAKVPELKVIARTSSFAFKDQKVEIAEIARRLNVAHVLEGSVRKSGNTVRITAQLVRATDSTHLWSETYDRPLDNIFAVQDEIAGTVVEQLKVTLLGVAPRSRVTDPKAYALFLRARQLSEQFTPESLRESTALYEQALQIDPRYPESWRKLAANVLNEADYNLRPLDEARAQARDYIAKALEIDPDYGRAHDGLAILASNSLDPVAAARHWQRALELDPTNLDILANATGLLYLVQPIEDVIRIDQYVLDRDPVSPISHANLAWDYVYAGRLPEALEAFRVALTLSPGALGRQANIAWVLLLMGDAQAALQAVETEPFPRARLSVQAAARHRLGDTAGSDAALEELIAQYGESAPYVVASVTAWRGEADRAFAALQTAAARRDKSLLGLSADPMFASLRTDPRWLPFLRANGVAPEQLAAIPFEVKLPEH